MHKNLLARFAESRHAFLILACIGIALVLPSLAAGLFADDFIHYVLIREGHLVKQPDNISLFHLFSFIDTSPERRLQLFGFSLTPWWVSEQFSLLFFRPLSELSHYIDYRFLQNHVPLMHFHSILWYALLLGLITHCYKLFCPTHKVALLAFLLFIADATHGFTVAWLANRNALIAATFSLLALASHHQFRETQKLPYYILSLLSITCSFLAAEAGIVVGVLLLAYALFMDKAGPLKGVQYLLPALAIFIIWFSLYKHYGYGAIGNRAYYIDPVESPALFLQNLPDRMARIIAMQFNILPVHLYKPYPVFMASLGAFFLVALLVPLLRKPSRSYRFFLCILLLSIIPITSSELQDRNMLYVGIAACPLLAELIRYLWHLPQRLLAKGLITLIVLFHIIISALLMLPTSYGPKIMAQNSITAARSLPGDITNNTILSFGIPLLDASYTAAIRRTENLPLPQQFWNVTTSTYGLQVTRIDDHHFIMENSHGLLGGIDLMLRDMTFDPLPVGETVNMNGLLLTIDAVNAAGTPIKATLAIDPSIKPGNIALYYWQASRLLPFNLGAGESRIF
jgi:hypothetical protein